MVEKYYGFTINQLIGFIVLITIVGLAVIFLVPINSQGQTLLEIFTAPDIVTPVACIEIFAPVCGTDGVTYSNSCFAEVAGVAILHEGECTGDGGEMLVSEPTSTFCRIYPTFAQCR